MAKFETRNKFKIPMLQFSYQPFVRIFSATCEEVFPWGSLPPADSGTKTEYSSWARQQGFKIQSLLASRTVFHGKGFLAAGPQRADMLPIFKAER